MTAMDFMTEGIMTTIIGMGVVFVVLIVLSILIGVLDRAVDSTLGKKKSEPLSRAVSTPAPVPAAPVKITKTVPEGISPAVVAAITATISMVTGKEAGEFKIIGIQRAGSGMPTWALMGTTDIISTRQRYTERGNR